MSDSEEEEYKKSADPKGWADAFMEDVKKSHGTFLYEHRGLIEAYFRKAMMGSYALGYIDGERKIKRQFLTDAEAADAEMKKKDVIKGAVVAFTDHVKKEK